MSARWSKATAGGGAEGEYKAPGGGDGGGYKAKSKFWKKKCVQFWSKSKHRQLLVIILVDQSNYCEKMAGKYYIQNSERFFS